MDIDQTLILAILAGTVALFAWGRWRHDVVALAALIASVLAGLVPSDAAFAGFGHPAVITVAGVLVLSRGLQSSGAVDVLARRVLPSAATPVTSIVILTALAAGLSAFMNNVGALALLMPVAIQASARQDLPPGQLLMPLAFGSILGGMTTLIGTPPNLIVSGYRRDTLGAGYGMFDFTPVGLAIAVAGVAFIALIGWRLVPARKRAGTEGFESGAYFTEARVPEGAKAVGMSVRAVEDAVRDANVQVLGLVRREVRLRAPRPALAIREGDILVLEAEPDGLSDALGTLGLELAEAIAAPEAAREGEPPADDRKEAEAEGQPGEATDAKAKAERSAGDEEDIRLLEFVVAPNAAIIGRTAQGINLRLRYHVNLLAISHEGTRRVGRLRTTPIEAGDVLLVQGPAEAAAEFASDFGCLPLATRDLRLPDRRQALLASGILLAAVAAAASGAVSAPVAFMAGVLAAMVTRVVPPREAYEAIDWSVIVLLACLLPVAGAMLTTGAAEVVARFLVENVARSAPIPALVLVLLVTMTLSDVMNNAATVAVMAPIAYGAARALEANADAFFMAVAIGGSCAFLTPIGHQNNTLILGPGGFRFGDYWRLGLPIEVLVTLVGIPMILLVWGL